MTSGPYSRRTPDRFDPSPLARRAAVRRVEGPPFVDLTLADPTAAELPPGGAALAPLADPRAAAYRPHPLGLPEARAAVAEDRTRAHALSPPWPAEDVILTASTSEAYGFLFKLLCEPGDEIIVPAPGYPLFAHLAALEGVTAHTAPLRFEGSWRLEPVDWEAALTPRTRALILISPHNPTGWVLRRGQAAELLHMAAERGVAVIADEVFADFAFPGEAGWETPAWDPEPRLPGAPGRLPPADPPAARPSSATRAQAPPTHEPDCQAMGPAHLAAAPVAASRKGMVFTLGGLSKTAGLPQMKVGWILLGGDPARREATRERLEWIADAYLSVAQPQQLALPAWLAAAPLFRRALRERLCANRLAVAALARQVSGCELLPADGGWMAMLRLPGTRPDEEDALELLDRHAVLVHPGYIFDCPPGSFLVLSLLPPPPVFAAGLERLGNYLLERSS